MPVKNHGKKLITDKNTDYLFDYFMNEDKFNEQLRGEWDEQMEKKLENHKQPKLDSRIITEKNSSSGEEKELPSEEDVSGSSSNKPEVEFNDDDSDNDNVSENASESSVKSSRKSPFGQKIEAKPKIEIPQPAPIVNAKPLLAETLIADVPKYVETPEQRRSRAMDAYSELQDLVEKYGVKLNKDYTVDDDPDVMEAEIAIHRNRRHKANQVKFYKNMLINIISGVEFLNDRYNPFEFKLKDWSRQVATDVDDYTEILEEIYEKYKDKGGKMAPEIRLLFLIIMSGVTYHLSNSLFSAGGLNETIKNNPNILNKLMGGLMKNGLSGLTGGGNDHEPAEAKEAPKDNKKILDTIRNYNSNRQNDKLTTDNQVSETTNKSEALAVERERRLLAEQKAQFEEQMRKQNELFNSKLEQLRNQQLVQPIAHPPQIPEQNNIQQLNNYPPIYQNNPVNQVLSNATQKPRFMETTTPNLSPKNKKMDIISDDMDIFDVASNDKPNKPLKFSPKRKSSKDDLDELMESLDEITDSIDEIIETSNKKKSKPQASIRKPTNSATRSATKSITRRKGNDTGSDGMSTTKKNVFKL